MLKRYISVYWRNLVIIIIIIGLISISSVTKGKTATVTSVAAGIVMLYLAVKFIIWIIKTPAKKDKNAVV